LAEKTKGLLEKHRTVVSKIADFI